MYFLVDVETGGIDPHTTSLLTASFWLINDQLNMDDRVNLRVKHDVYKVSSGALAVNHIDILAHDREAAPIDALSELITSRLVDWVAQNNGNRLIPVGHNVDFDLNWLKVSFPKVEWSKFLDYHKIDTQVIARYLQMAGKLPIELKISLVSLARFFDIPHAAHTADGDCAATLDLLKAMMHPKVLA